MDGTMPTETPTSYPASAFHPDLPGGRGSGTLRVEPGRAVFEAGWPDPARSGLPGSGLPDAMPLTLELPFQELEVRLGGASDRLVFFTHPNLPAASVYTSDHRILDHPYLAAQAHVAGQVKRVRGKKLRGRAVTAAVLALIILAVGALVALKDPLVGLVADQVPATVEVELGEVFFTQIRRQVDLVDDAELEASLDQLVAPLLAALPDTGYAFDFHLAADPTLNAFALPGGHVVVHSGLVLEAETPEEVLGVLGHEIAHVTERHSLRQVVSAAGVYVVLQTVLGDLSGLAAVLADGGLELLTLEFSRDHERQADEVGFATLTAAGIDPRGMISFFDKLQAEQERLLGDAAALERHLGFLSTHPSSAERVERLAERWREIEGTVRFAPQAVDLEAFQDRIRQQIAGSDNAEPADGEPATGDDA